MRLMTAASAAVLAALSIGAVRAVGTGAESAQLRQICISFGPDECVHDVETGCPVYIGAWRIVIVKP